MTNRNETPEDIREGGHAKRIKLDADLIYLYQYKKDDDTSTTELVNQSQQLEVAYYDGGQWDPKYNLLEPKELQKFSSNIYNNYKTKPGEIELENLWSLLYCVQGTVLYGKSAGFYGELYFNSDKHCLLLVIKGTSSLGNGLSDIKNVVLKSGGGEIDSAFTFGEKVRKLIMKFKCKPMLMITGHSLGGYLAQIITFTITYFFKDVHGLVQSREKPSDDFGIYTVVFDSPAALQQLINLDQRDPIRPEILLLPIVNFIVDVNLVNCNSMIGSHLGQVVAVKSFIDLNTPSMWEWMWNVASFHGIINFQVLNSEEFRQVEYLPGKKSVKLDAKAIPSCTFSVLNFERLHKYIILSDVVAELANNLPKFKLSNSRIVIEEETVSVEEFIPRVHHFIAKYKDKLDRGKFDSKQIIDMVVFNLWRADMLEDANELRLNEELKQRVQQWQDGTKIGGFESYEEMRFVGCLLSNTIPRCFHYDYHKFLTLDVEQVRNFVIATKATLVLIVKEKNHYIQHKNQKEVKIVYLVLDSGVDVKIDKLINSTLHENSQEQLKNTELAFMGNKVRVLDVFGRHLLGNTHIWSIYSFHVESALKDDFFYCDQMIASEEKKYKYKSATEFANELSKGKLKFVLIASDAGMGKTTALMQIAKTMQNRLQNYWIVHLNLFSIQRELNAANGKLHTVVAAIEIVRNAALAKRKGDKILKKVFDWKVEAKEMVLMFDSLDEICPTHRETADILLKFLRETELQIVVTSRPHEGKNFKDAQIFSVAPIKYRDRDKFVSQKCQMMGILPPSDISSWFDKINNERYTVNFWSVPLILNMAIDIFDPSEASEAVSDKIQKTNIFATFIRQSISNTLVDKMNYESSLASGGYSEKFDLYDKLIQILAICTIFHAGEVALDFQNKIEKHRDFIKRFDMAKIDDCNKVAFLHRSFAEYLVARLFVQNQQAKSCKQILLDENQLKCILFKKEFSDMRKHICTILAMNSPNSTTLSGCIINGEETLLLKILIKEDRYELYMAFKVLLCSQINKSMMCHVNYVNTDTPPLYYALNKARDEFVQQLISDGAYFKAILSQKYVLHLAIEKGLYEEVINHFESLKSNINEYGNSYPNRPLLIAAKKGSREMVEFLIENGADVNYEYSDKQSALYFAIEANSAEIIELLIAKKANSAEALNWAAQLNRKEILDIIYEKYTPIESREERLRESFRNAIAFGHLELIKHMTDIPEAQLREVEENVDTFLHIAASNGHLHCMDFIFEYQKQSIDVRNEVGQTPLMNACCEEGTNETVEWLLKKNANVKAVDNDGLSCMHYAAHQFWGNDRLVEILLSANAEINLKDNKGLTPLFYALGVEHNDNSDDMVKYLLENTSADANVSDNEGNTCLHISSKYGDYGIVELLLKHVATVNYCENHKKETPIHWAAYEGHDDIVELLLKEGAKHNLAASNEETILRLAKLFNGIEWETIEELKEKKNSIRSEISSWRYIVRDNNLSS